MVYTDDPDTIVLSPGNGYMEFYAADPKGMVRDLVRLLNHETLHAAMKRIGLREWKAIDRLISFRKEDFRMGLCNPENALGFAKDEDNLVRFTVTQDPKQTTASVVERPPGEGEHDGRGDVEQEVVAGRGKVEGEREPARTKDLGRRQEKVLQFHGTGGTGRMKDER
ncbi:MAG: hypothetical protein KGJ23_08520 [Euryarchaeota archaeon]|nr:hypothetical protein [Euryarchaeota archaeon]MDE2044616.1 hypothetical protein [Thermoplasmata archaeon]